MEKRADGLAEVIKLTTDQIPQAVRTGQDTKKKEKSRKSVYIYVATLFLVVFLFTLLSYFMQQRNNTEISTLHEKNATAQLNIENLQNTNVQLQSDNEMYQKQLTDMQTRITELESQLTELRKAWQADVQSVMNTDRAAYNDLMAKYNELVEMNENKVKK